MTDNQLPDAPGDQDERVPTVIADRVGVVHRVHGVAAPHSARPVSSGRGSAATALARMLRRPATALPGTRTVHAVRGVSFIAYEGESIGVVGTNGSGKSTLLKAVAGLLPLSSGRLWTCGRPSLLGVGAALMNDLSGERNVHLGALASGMSRDEARDRHEEIIDFSGIDEKGDFRSLPMRTYSSGMRARLRFSVATARDHDVLLVDEALATGDASFRRRSRERIRELTGRAGTVFLVSHQSKDIRENCDRVLWLEHGSLLRDGPTEQVLAEYEEFTRGR